MNLQPRLKRLAPVFYELLVRSFDRWSKQPHLLGYKHDPLHKFELISRRMGEACRIWVAWVNGQPAATLLVHQYGNDSRGVMDKNHLNRSRYSF
jgi:hypothetical protein